MKLDGAGLRKVQPKLRMVANGSTEVNVLRAEHACSVAVSAGAGRGVRAGSLRRRGRVRRRTRRRRRSREATSLATPTPS